MQTLPYLLTQEEADSISEMLDLYLVSYQALAVEAGAAAEALWKIRPKFLYMSHISDWTREARINPRYTGCAYDEDYLGKLKRTTCRTHAATFMLRSLQRIVLGWSLRWEKRRRSGRFRL